MTPTVLEFMRARQTLRHASAACDYVFAAARGVPRQGVLRAAIDAQRLARSAPRATPGKRT